MAGLPFNILAVLTDKPLHSLVARPDIKTIAELRGKRIGSQRIGRYAKLAGRMVSFHVNSVESLRQDQKALTTILDDAAKMAGIDAVRLAEVRAEVAALARIS